jgi:hypothetical protein
LSPPRGRTVDAAPARIAQEEATVLVLGWLQTSRAQPHHSPAHVCCVAIRVMQSVSVSPASLRFTTSITSQKIKKKIKKNRRSRALSAEKKLVQNVKHKRRKK